MKPLDQLSLWQRIALAIAVVIGALLLLMILTRLFGGDDADAQQTDLPNVYIYEDIPLDAHLIVLDKQALEDAYAKQLSNLWGVWLKNRGESVNEVSNGLRIARSAYAAANKQISRRQRELEEYIERGQQQKGKSK